MTKKRMVFRGMLMAALLLPGIVSAGGNRDAGTQAGGAEGGYRRDLRIAVSAAPETLDIAFSTSAVAQQMTKGAIYESLVYIKSDFSIGLELAESFRVNDDSSVYTYTLRRGVKFHNGQDFKAGDAAASLNRWLELYGSSVTKGASFREVDDYTITIDLGHPMLYLNELIATAENNAIIVPKAIADGAGTAKPITEYVGTGPYRFTEWATDRYILLSQYEGYVPYGTKGDYSGWGGYKEALTPQVYYYFSGDDNTRIAGIQTGEYDIVAGIPVANYGLFENNPDFNTHELDGGDHALVFNKKQGVASNPKFRQALQAAVNNDDILLAALTNKAFYNTDSSYIIPPDSEWYTKAGSEYYNVHNEDTVRRLLREANYNGEPFRLLTSNTYAVFYNEGIVVEQQLKKAGINVELIVQDWATYFSTRSDPGKWDAFITGFDVTVLPPFILYLSPSWAGFADDPTLQNGLAEITTAADKKSVIAKWVELQRYCLAEYVPVLKFGNSKAISVSTAKTEGGVYFISPHPWNVRVRR
ncbi:MAG: ABC transporter substrate-binding protein [Spirochaetaceae bacterium]|nr:ABC transporter substrate-binding protein [Spirochaetaceae bacterium]